MVDSKENDKFDLGVKGLTVKFQQKNNQTVECCRRHLFSFLQETHVLDDEELARKLHEDEKNLRSRRHTAKRPVVSLCLIPS